MPGELDSDWGREKPSSFRLTLFRVFLSVSFSPLSLLYACNYIAPEPLKSQRPPSSLFSFPSFLEKKKKSSLVVSVGLSAAGSSCPPLRLGKTNPTGNFCLWGLSFSSYKDRHDRVLPGDTCYHLDGIQCDTETHPSAGHPLHRPLALLRERCKRLLTVCLGSQQRLWRESVIILATGCAQTE